MRALRLRSFLCGLGAASAALAAVPAPWDGGDARERRLTAQILAHPVLGRGLDERHALRLRPEAGAPAAAGPLRAQQVFQGRRVLGGEVVVRTGAKGEVEALAHALVRNLNLNVDPTLETGQALAIAHGRVLPSRWYAETPTSELVIYPVTRLAPRKGVVHAANAADFETVVERHELAYLVRLVVEDGSDTRHEHLLIQAHTGEVLRQWSDLHTSSESGTGQSQHSGTVTLSTNSVVGGFELRDPLRSGNLTTNMANGTSGMGTVYTSETNAWGDGANYVQANGSTSANGQTAAVDAHFGMQVTWDLLGQVLGRNGIDGTGRTVTSRVHYSSAYDNAFWSDACFCMTFGDGSTFKVLTSLDVAAHEMGHGVCATTAALTYAGESGGLNESNSDIFGTMAEFYAWGAGGTGTVIPESGGNWTIGEQLATPSFPRPLRYMHKPSLDGRSPDAWSATLGNLDVHYSSGPMNRCFYFLSQGTGSGETASAYLPGGMTGLGNDKALRIWWRTLSTRLTSSSNYLAARNGAIAAVRELYGAGGAEEAAVWNAFAAINVGAAWGSSTPSTDTVAPTVTAQASQSGAQLTFTATASDDVGVTRVDFLVDGALKGSASSAPHVLTLAANALVVGTHSLVAKAYDAAGNVGTSAARSFTVAAMIPTVTPLVTGTSGSLTFTATVQASVAVARVEYTVDGVYKGKATVAPYTFPYSSVAMANGNHTLVAKVFDALNQSGTSAPLTFLVDNDRTAPTVVPAVAGSAGTLGFSASVSDNVGAVRVEYFVNGGLKGKAYAAPWAFDFVSTALPNGTYSLVAKAVDAAGNVGTSSPVPFPIANPDILAPVVTAKATSTLSAVALGVTASDKVGVVRVDFLVDGASVGSRTAAPFTLSLAPATFAEGPHSFVATASDAAGNVGTSAPVTFLVDRTAPTVAPAISGTWGTLGFTAEATDNFGVARVEYFVDGALKGKAIAPPYTFGFLSTAVPNGTHQLVAKAYDALGNVGVSPALPFLVDNDRTLPTVTAAVSGNSGILTLSATAADDRGVVRVDFYLNNVLKGSATEAPYTLAFDSTLIVQGAFSLVAKAYDAANNVGASAPVAFTVTNPDISAPTLTAKAMLSATTLTLSAAAKDNVAVARVTYLLDGSPVGSATVSPFTVILPATAVADGRHELVAQAADAAGNVGASPAVAFAKDTLAPTVQAFVSGTAGTLTFSADAWDAVGVTRVEFYVDGALKGKATTAPYALPFLSTPLANGNHLLVAKAYDALNHVGISPSLAFTVDNDRTAPTVTASVSGSRATITFRAVASDNLGVTRVEFYVDGAFRGSSLEAPYAYAFDSTLLTKGNHTLVAKAIDAAGNKGSSAALVFPVDNTPPTNLWETESNDTVSSANPVADSVLTVRGTLPVGSDLDTYAIGIPSGGTLRVTLTIPVGTAFGLAQVQGATAQVLANGASVLTFSAPATGLSTTVIYLQVFSTNGVGSTGTYTLTLQR